MAMADEPVPTLFAWMGGMPAIERLFGVFYSKVPFDPVLAPVFAKMPPDHVQHVSAFVAEVFGGPKTYGERMGGHRHMLGRHIGRNLTEAQRARWMQLLLQCADETGLPGDPEFRSALVAYLEWGTRIAVLTSHSSAVTEADSPMPKWGWGEVGGPFIQK
jgi:hemoglobin